MNKFLPNYSFISLFVPYAKNYNNNISINYITDICYIKYVDDIKLLNYDINTSITINEGLKNHYKINTLTQFKYNNIFIDERLDIEYNYKTYKIKYNINNNIIDLNKFNVESNNLELLLEYYKFIDDKYYNVFKTIKNNIK